MGDTLDPRARAAMIRVMRALEDAQAVPAGAAAFVVLVVHNPGDEDEGDTVSVMSASLPNQDAETMVRALVGAARAIDARLTSAVTVSTREGEPPTGHA